MIVNFKGAAIEVDATKLDRDAFAKEIDARSLNVDTDGPIEAQIEAYQVAVCTELQRRPWRAERCTECGAMLDADRGCAICDTEAAQPSLTDAGNARRFVILHGDHVRYCAGRGWLVFDGKVWTSSAHGVERLAKQTARSIYAEAEHADDPKATAQHAARSESARGIVAMLRLAQSEPGIPVGVDAFDRDPMLLNTPSGTVDLRTGELHAHDAADLLTHMTAAAFDADAESPLWDRVLTEAMGGDEALVAFLARVFGYSATGSTAEEKLFLLHGAGAGSKSTIIEAIKAGMGSYAMTADFSTFLAREDSGPRPDIARLAGARIVTSNEVEKGRRIAEGLIKSITGGDVVTARRLYQESVTFKPAFTLFLVANDAPRADDEDTGLWRRVVRVPFDHVVPKERRDPKIKAQLCDVKISGPAILAWLVRGALEWQRIGLEIPEVIEAATAAYRDAQDPLADFFADECSFKAKAWTPRDALRKAYEAWAKKAGGRFPITPRTMADRLRRREGIKEVRRGGERGWLGVALTENEDECIPGTPVTLHEVRRGERSEDVSEDRRRRAARGRQTPADDDDDDDSGVSLRDTFDTSGQQETASGDTSKSAASKGKRPTLTLWSANPGKFPLQPLMENFGGTGDQCVKCH